MATNWIGRYVTYLFPDVHSDHVIETLTHHSVMLPCERIEGNYARVYDKYGRLVSEGPTKGYDFLGLPPALYPSERRWKREGTL